MVIRSRRMNWVGHVARVCVCVGGGRRNTCDFLLKKSDREIPFGRAEFRPEDNIKVN